MTYRWGNQQNMSFSQQNVLANSIRVARQRIGKGQDGYHYHNQSSEHDHHHDSHNQTFSFSKPKKENSAAQAIKVLHARISQLQAFNITLTKQVAQSKRQITQKSTQIHSLKSQLNNSNNKLILLQQQSKKMQLYLNKKQSELNQLQKQIKQKEYKFAKTLTQKDISIQQLSKLRQMLQQKIIQMNKRLDNNQKVIVQMIKQLQEQKNKNNQLALNTYNAANNYLNNHSINNYAQNKTNNHFNSPQNASNSIKVDQKHRNSKSNRSKQYDNFPVIVDQPDSSKQLNPIYKIESSKKYRESQHSRQTSMPRRIIKNSNSKKDNKNIQNINKQLKQKNQQLYNMLRASDRKYRQQEKLKNTFKQKFYALKQVADAIIEEINRLPTNCLHKFKCMMVKVKKIENQNIQCLRSHTILYGNKNRSKTSRNSSKQSSAKSKSKQKPLKMEDLSISDQEMQEISQTKSRSKSKKRSITYHKNSSSKKHNKKYEDVAADNEQNQVVKTLNRRVRDQRKQLFELHKKINEEKDENKIEKMKVELNEKMKQNIQLVSHMQSYKITKI